MKHLSPTFENLLYVLLLTLGALMLLVSLWHYRHVKTTTGHALDDYHQMQILAKTIHQLKQRPALAGSDELELAELSRLIEQASKEASVPLDRLVRIWPEQPQRMRDSVYLEKPTQILFRGITLRQCITFLHGISNTGSGLRIKSLRISAPRDEPQGDTWIVETTLTYLIYSPTTSVAQPESENPILLQFEFEEVRIASIIATQIDAFPSFINEQIQQQGYHP